MYEISMDDSRSRVRWRPSCQSWDAVTNSKLERTLLGHQLGVGAHPRHELVPLQRVGRPTTMDLSRAPAPERQLTERLDRFGKAILDVQRVPLVGRLIGRFWLERTKVFGENAVAFQQKSGHAELA
jgi:hypothetical protein